MVTTTPTPYLRLTGRVFGTKYRLPNHNHPILFSSHGLEAMHKRHISVIEVLWVLAAPEYTYSSPGAQREGEFDTHVHARGELFVVTFRKDWIDPDGKRTSALWVKTAGLRTGQNFIGQGHQL